MRTAPMVVGQWTRAAAVVAERVFPKTKSAVLPVARTKTGVASMEMHQIRYFLALSEELNFTRAARRCGVTQPSLTNAMRALERELGAPLFHRRPRIELTALGGAIRPYLQEIARHAHNARET